MMWNIPVLTQFDRVETIVYFSSKQLREPACQGELVHPSMQAPVACHGESSRLAAATSGRTERVRERERKRERIPERA